MAEVQNNEDEEFVVVDTPPEEQAQGDQIEDQDDGEGDEDSGDERLATSEDDHDDEIAASNRKRRQERKDRQRRAREAQEHELAFLRSQVQQLSQRVSATEGYTMQSHEQALAATYHAALREAQQAEQIMAKALEAGNGEDHVAAQRIRDAAYNRAQQAQVAHTQAVQTREQQAQPQVAPATVSYANEWMQANPWYNPQGGDEDSAIVNAIDTALTQQGYDPTQRGYWEELSRRVSQRLAPEAAEPAGDRSGAPRRKAPPQGGTREHAPASTRKEVYVTPERKQAMIDAGVWDDPQARNRMLKAYSEYDKQNTAR